MSRSLPSLLPFIVISLFTIAFLFYSSEKIFNSPFLHCYFRMANSSPEKKVFDENKILSDIRENRIFETTIECVGSSYNRSCLYKNLYYAAATFIILTTKTSYLPAHDVRINAFEFWQITPRKIVFNTSKHLEHYARRILNPTVIPGVTLHFGAYWHHNIGHALFDGLYAGYVALIRFPPRHLQPFRILAGIADCRDCWSEDVFSRFAGLGILKKHILNKVSKRRWFVFDELVMGSGVFCQRCIQSNFQLPGGVSRDASRLFRDRMYRQHGLLSPTQRLNHSGEGRTHRDILSAYIIDNKRYTEEDRKEIDHAMSILNNYTLTHLNATNLQWPLIRVQYIYYNRIEANKNRSIIQVNTTAIDSRSPVYELIENNFMAQLKLLREMDIHISGPGTGQMYQTFLSDGSVNVNVGGIRPWASENTKHAFASYIEQYMTSGAPYIKGLYYPINERPQGIKAEQLVMLIRQAGVMIFDGFTMPVDPKKNLAADGQLFVEMCQRDEKFCRMVTERVGTTSFACIDFCVEDFVHEHRQWREGGFLDHGQNLTCPFNHTLLRILRKKYGINHDPAQELVA